MDVRLPDGTVIRGVPDGTSKADLTAKLARNGYDVSKLGGLPSDVPQVGADGHVIQQKPVPAAEEPRDNLLGVLVSPVDAALSAGSAIAGAVAGPIAGVGKSIIDGKFGTAEGARQAEEFGSKVAQKIARPPATQAGRKILEAVGAVGEPLGALPTAELASLAGAAGNATRAVRGAAAATAAVQDAADAATVATKGPSLRDLVRAPQQLSGVGAAEASQATTRAARAQSLPVPIKLTKGQLTRNREQVAFERETAKQKEGAPLASNYEDQNAQFGQNLDAAVDTIGAENFTPRAVGKSVVAALDAKDTAKRAEISNLYQKARDAGELQQPVDVTSLAEWVKRNKGKDRLAPIVSVIESELKQNAKVEGGGVDLRTLTKQPARTTMSLEASEDLRQAIGKLAEPGTPNVVFGKEAKGIIDAAQEGKGGDLFRQARRAYENYANEFENRDVIAKALRTKPGTKDRAVKYEGVFDHAILNSSTDDVRHIFRVLEAHPASAAPEVVAAGQQAARDLRGAVINHIKDEMQKNLNVDSAGARTGSPAKIDAIVRELDKDGKLEVIFGKKGADQVRDLRDVAIDIYTSPSGTVNSSNTASALMRKLDDVAAYTKATPVLGKVIKYTTDQIHSANTRRKVRDAINPNLKDLAGKGGN
jgi:enamine deaminase RidA (YjgF/YER057c/UK114 family)